MVARHRRRPAELRLGGGVAQATSEVDRSSAASAGLVVLDERRLHHPTLAVVVGPLGELAVAGLGLLEIATEVLEQRLGHSGVHRLASPRAWA